jgi:hypothetical protein
MAPNLVAPNPNLTRQANPFMYATDLMEDGDLNTRHAGKPAATKKKGGAMNAPPLEGSDTSVSSPKRQTAEAVRCNNHAKLTLSQARLCAHVISVGHDLAALDLKTR